MLEELCVIVKIYIQETAPQWIYTYALQEVTTATNSVMLINRKARLDFL